MAINTDELLWPSAASSWFLAQFRNRSAFRDALLGGRILMIR